MIRSEMLSFKETSKSFSLYLICSTMSEVFNRIKLSHHDHRRAFEQEEVQEHRDGIDVVEWEEGNVHIR